MAAFCLAARSAIRRRSRSAAYGVAHRLHTAELDSALDHRAHVRVTLLLVGVKQLRVATAQHQVELEREVLGVADSGAHALTEKRWHLMSRITGKHDPSDPPRARYQRPEGVGGHADQFGVFGAQIAGGSVPDALGLTLLVEV
jgi:hypothetical protein